MTVTDDSDILFGRMVSFSLFPTSFLVFLPNLVGCKFINVLSLKTIINRFNFRKLPILSDFSLKLMRDLRMYNNIKKYAAKKLTYTK